MLKNDLDNALEDFTTALKIHENDASALVGVGVVKSRKGKPTDGSREIQHAIDARAGHHRPDQEARRGVGGSPYPSRG